MSNNTDKMIPLDFSQNITPAAIGDILWNEANQVKISVNNGNINRINGRDDNSHLFVVSFADRPNTGKQPVGDDVAVNAYLKGQWLTYDKSCNFDWAIKDGIEKWKPNHSAMLKQYQAEQGLQKLDEGDVIMVNSRDELADAVIAKAEDKPVYTQAMSDKNELPPIGSKCMADIEGEWFESEVYSHYKDVVHVYLITDNTFGFCRDLSDLKPIDNRTDEEKLSDAVYDAANGLTVDDSLIESLLSSDKFTITLNK